MEQKIITMPFEVKLAKKIQTEQLPGKIVTRSGKNARIVCFDVKGELEILALLTCEDNESEKVSFYNREGLLRQGYSQLDDLVLQVPEWTQYKDGDVLLEEIDEGGKYPYKTLHILRGDIGIIKDEPFLISYLSYDCDSRKDFDFIYNYSYKIRGSIRLATEEEKQMFIKRLKEEITDKSKGPRPKEFLKLFFGIEKKEEYKFEPFDKVLVRCLETEKWLGAFFSYYDEKLNHPYITTECCGFKYCIPYNEQTKHLLGTTDNWEE